MVMKKCDKFKEPILKTWDIPYYVGLVCNVNITDKHCNQTGQFLYIVGCFKSVCFILISPKFTM